MSIHRAPRQSQFMPNEYSCATAGGLSSALSSSATDSSRGGLDADFDGNATGWSINPMSHGLGERPIHFIPTRLRRSYFDTSQV